MKKERKDLVLLTEDEFSNLEMLAVRGGSAAVISGSGGFCKIYTGNCVSGCACGSSQTK